ncbi:MAG: hypothetical protein HFI74_06690 [Lachnospiraceae bacterium]|jgi:hypothetical protein|nr:hypothetical protein [Lachnospiraceae bacterium]
MVKSFEETARERKNYVEQARAAFHNSEQTYTKEQAPPETVGGTSTLGIRFVIAILLFACFVYCDQEKITFQGIGTQQIVQQIKWKPFPTEKIEEVLGNINISGSH